MTERYVKGTDASSAVDYFAVTPSDSTNHAFTVRGYYVGGAGNLVAVTEGGVAVTFTNVQAGSTLAIRSDRVNSTSTTATNIVGLY